FDCATWLHKARSMPKDEFKREVQKELTGQETEPWEIIYFKLYKSQIPVVEQAIETAAMMLGTDKSRGYCLEMICADFLAGADLARNRALGNYLLQALQEPESGHRAGPRDGGSDAWKRPLPWLLPRADVCRLFGRSKSGRRWRSRGASAGTFEFLQLPAVRT